MRKFILSIDENLKEIVDSEQIFYIEAAGGDSRVRLSAKRIRIDQRRLEEIEQMLGPYGFLRVHRSFLVNIDRIRLLRRREDSQDWEVVLDPPVNKVVPISRSSREALIEALQA